MFVQTEFNKSNNNNDLNRATHHDPVAGGYEELFKDLDLISRFCMPICSRDNEVREVALDVISKTVEGWLDGVGSPKHYRLAERRRIQTASNGCACSDIVGNPVNDIPKEYLELVTLHLPIILRLSLSCPFVNVREKCQHILDVVQRRGIPVPYPLILGPSAYIDPDELPPLGTYNEKVSHSKTL
ncbi:hypothetical protein ILUMI_07248 [Ignelater luminosus]|uniref:Uncharacterized protein n=1 Tax=Ignelater luminosus TaxID=2038154 RepID=A0A8K0GGH9_IGNLU|nr:hypothetical protein ILUMI_07248 [Ignelater luminosus]